MPEHELLKKLCLSCGISGEEEEVRELILSEIRPAAERWEIDPLGNLIVFKKGRKSPRRRLMLCAHMDEVGMIVTYITPEGLLKFDCVGGIHNSALFARQVLVGKNRVPGVVCAKPVHVAQGDERKKCPSAKDLTIDIGASTAEEAGAVVSVGDAVYFDAPYEEKGGFVIGKAIDDRLGCAVLIAMLQREQPYDMTYVFTVREEIGLQGAAAAAFTVAPDDAIIVESTTAADTPFAEGEQQVCRVGEGAVVSLMDRSTIYDREYYDLAMKTAERIGVKAQTKTMIAGGNDAGAVHRSRGGVRTAAVSVPCRYLHGSSSLIAVSDAEAVAALTEALAEAVLSRGEEE